MMPASPEAAPAYAERLGLVAWLWSLLGPSTHIVLLGIFACAGALPAYFWARITLGNVLLVGLYFEHYRRERAHVAANWGP